MRSNLTVSQVVEDALEHGHSLDWQERLLAKVEAATAAAERGDIATEDEVRAVAEKYRRTP